MAEEQRRRWEGQLPTDRLGLTKAANTARARTAESTRRGTHRFLTGHNPRTGHRGAYTVVIAIEYLACMVIVFLSLGLVGARGDVGTVDKLATPAIVMVRLSAVTLLFFVLAIFSVGRQSGRLSAAFGGLVAAGVALNATNEWKSLAGVFSAGRKAPSKEGQ